MAWVSAAVINARSKHALSHRRDEWVDIDFDDVPTPEVAVLTQLTNSTHRVPALHTVERAIENQRWWPTTGWSQPCLGSDPPPWTSPHGWRKVPPDLFEIPGHPCAPRAAEPCEDVKSWWCIDYSYGPPEDEGFLYSFDFSSQEWHQGCGPSDMVRRRQWTRLRGATPPPPQHLGSSLTCLGASLTGGPLDSLIASSNDPSLETSFASIEDRSFSGSLGSRGQSFGDSLNSTSVSSRGGDMARQGFHSDESCTEAQRQHHAQHLSHPSG